jgi:hypothetical protein
MKDEENYNGREGFIEQIDDFNQLHGTWGGLAVIPEKDTIELINDDYQAQIQKSKSDEIT